MGPLRLTKEQRAAIPKAPGVYRLIADGVVVYVGVSSVLYRRIVGHSLRGQFNAVEYRVDALSELRDLERSWIAKYKPTLNKRDPYYYPPASAREAKMREPKATSKKPYVYGSSGRSYLVHRVGQVSAYRPAFSEQSEISLSVTAKCGVIFRLSADSSGRLADEVPAGATLCARCDGGKATFPYKSEGAVPDRAHARFALEVSRPQEAA